MTVRLKPIDFSKLFFKLASPQLKDRWHERTEVRDNIEVMTNRGKSLPYLLWDQSNSFPDKRGFIKYWPNECLTQL